MLSLEPRLGAWMVGLLEKGIIVLDHASVLAMRSAYCALIIAKGSSARNNAQQEQANRSHELRLKRQLRLERSPVLAHLQGNEPAERRGIGGIERQRIHVGQQ